MAEVTDINKGKGTAQKMVAEATSLLRQYKEIPFVPENEPELYAAFGGKPGAGKVKTPSKFTAKQTIALLEFSGFPLADENAKFSIADAVRLEAPDMFDEATFESYEKDFGTVMQMQEDNAAVSKNVTTESAKKEIKNVNVSAEPLTEIELVQRMKSGEATAKEVIDYAMADPDISASRKKQIKRLYAGFNKLGLDINMPYKDLKNKEVARLFTKEGSPDKANRATPIQSLEKGLENSIFNKYGLRAVSEKVGDGIEVSMYPVLTGEGSLIGTQRTGGVGERPMRGLITMEDYTKIYAEALPEVEEAFGQPTADLLKYHALTANRPSQLLGLKKSQVTIGNGKITIAGKPKTNTDKKGRPTLTYDLSSPTGQLLERNYNSSKSDKLFDVTEVDFENAFNKHVGTRLEAFSDKLPLADVKVYEADGKTVKEIVQKPVTSVSAVRAIVPKIMLDQYNIPEGLVQGAMGHANTTILRKNYAGIAPETDLPKLLENPSSFSVGMFGTNQTNINLDLLSDEDKEAIRKEQTETLIQETQARRATAISEQIRAKASVSDKDIERASQVDEALVRAEEEKRLKKIQIREQVRAEAKGKVEAPSESTLVEGDVFNADKLSDEGQSKLKKLFPNLFKTVVGAVPGVAAGVNFASEVEAGTPPAVAALKSVIAETPAGDVMAAQELGEQAAKPVVEKLSKSVPEEGFISGLSRALTGQGMGMNYSSGGFINKNGR